MCARARCCPWARCASSPTNRPPPRCNCISTPVTGRIWLYEDDGDTLAYQQGEYRRSRFVMTWSPDRRHPHPRPQPSRAPYRPAYDALAIHLHGDTIQAAQVDGIAPDQRLPSLAPVARRWLASTGDYTLLDGKI